jgi:hypothetical protein
MVILEADGFAVEPHGVMNSPGNALLCLFSMLYFRSFSKKKDETDFITCRGAAAT